MLKTLEPLNRVKNKNAEAHFKNPSSQKMKSVYNNKRRLLWNHIYVFVSKHYYFVNFFEMSKVSQLPHGIFHKNQAHLVVANKRHKAIKHS